MDEDVAQGRVPTLVVVSAGSPAIGLVDPLQGLQDLCKRHEAWLHVEGHALAALCLVSVPNLVRVCVWLRSLGQRGCTCSCALCSQLCIKHNLSQ